MSCREEGQSRNSVRVAETERRLRLAKSDLARNFRHVLIKRATNVFVIAENKCLFELKPNSDDVFRIFQCKVVSLLRFEFVLE